MKKPLFIPLKKQWFIAFKIGLKTKEYRTHGPRWNERVCEIGRRVVICCGYRGERLYGVITGFSVCDGLAIIEILLDNICTTTI